MIIRPYLQLMRLDKPIGLFLLLWPTLWALWLASNGHPHLSNVIIFVAGVIVMRSAGCVINDVADRNFDQHVTRTRQRPLATHTLTVQKALGLFVFLLMCALALVLQLNLATILLACLGVVLTVIYPFMKRITHLPQLGLGLAFAWGVPMAFAAETHTVSFVGWMLFVVAAVWPVIYDTMYAMVDKTDDLKVGIKSTAILLGKNTVFILAILQLIFLSIFGWLGTVFGLHWPFFLSLAIGGGFFLYQLWLIRTAIPGKCFKAFLNNHWVGLIIFCGIVLSYQLTISDG